MKPSSVAQAVMNALNPRVNNRAQADWARETGTRIERVTNDATENLASLVYASDGSVWRVRVEKVK